jgi:hypothetical protein
LSKGLEIYRHSGKIPPVGVLVAVGGSLVGASVLGWLYTEFICGIPWIYINLIAVLVFGYGVGAITSWLLRLGKIRNPNVPGVLAITVAFVGLYVAWAHDVTVRGLYEEAHFSLRPSYVWAYVQDFNRNGGWSLDENMVTGAALWGVWLVETCLVVFFAWNGSKDALELAVYCEPCQRWTQLDREVNRMERGQYDFVLDLLLTGDFKILNGRMGDARVQNYVRLDLNTCSGCTRSNYVTLLGVTTSINTDSGGNRVETRNETMLGAPFRIPAAVANGFKTATPAWVEAGLTAPAVKASGSGSEEGGSGSEEREPERKSERKSPDPEEETRRQRRREYKEERPKARRRKKRSVRNMSSGVILLHCPHCDHESRIPSDFAGKRGKCPRCRGQVRVPER